MKTEMGHKEEERNSPELSTGKSTHRRAIQLISSLISLSHSVKVFPVKWQLIRNKLEELNSGLTAAQNGDLNQNSELWDLIPAMLLTVSECYEFARQCVNMSYSGKLLMQSDLDVVSAKFELHLKTLAGVCTIGIPNHSSVILVSRPGIGACQDDMKFYVKDLLTRLKIGDLEMKSQALVAMNEVVGEEFFLKIVVETDEIISLLVNFLDFAETEIQEESIKVISVIAGNDLCKSVLVGAGIIAPLIRILESGSDLGKKRAARTLQILTENSDNAWLVSAHGGVTALLNICSNGDEKGETIGPACGVLRNLVGVEEIKKFMVEEGAISAFIKLIRSKDEVSQINSIEFLKIMASGDEAIRQMIIRAGGIQSLIRVLDPKFPFSSKAREISIQAIESFCFSSTSSINILLGCGFLDLLLFFIRSGEVSVQELAVKATYRLSGVSEEIKKEMGDVGFMPELVRLLDAKSFEIREMAAEALSNMVLVPRNRRRFVQEDCNVCQILQLLKPEEGKSGNRKLLLSTLMSLSSSNSGRRKIVNSDYLKNLEKLAEAEVTDAKKLVRKLSTNRFHCILKGFWNS
ncbi:hypothetical protein HHK36_003782 [Tetracentron sinense]|uniref:DUF7032 domain-containing protein n=1 Tax=Tetracentron sinense TaxID=13715 RepID=A0A834ZTK4_TETSI|nr:hypothetical protein HHK36_003782 [Tetracentron sinense]